MKQICLYCQKEFEAKDIRVRSCSEECKINHRRKYQRQYFKQPKWVEYMRIKNREKARENMKDPIKREKMNETNRAWRKRNPGYSKMYYRKKMGLTLLNNNNIVN